MELKTVSQIILVICHASTTYKTHGTVSRESLLIIENELLRIHWFKYLNRRFW